MDAIVLREAPGPELEKAWRAFLARADFPVHYTTPEFFREPFFAGMRPFAVLARTEGRVVGVVTGIHEGHEVISGLTPRPQTSLDETVPILPVSRTLADGLLQEANGAELITVYSWKAMPGFVERGFRLTKRDDAIVMLDLSRGPDRLFKDFSENRRTNIRKAIKRGVEVALATTAEEFAAYYRIYAEWSRRKGIPVVAAEDLARALTLTENRRLYLARFEGRIIAGVIVRFTPGGLIEYTANASLEEEQGVKPNDVLHWRVIEWAYAQGFTRYSLGGAHLFLRKFGGVTLPVYRHRRDCTWLRRHDHRDAAVELAAGAVRRLPPAVGRGLRRLLGTAGAGA